MTRLSRRAFLRFGKRPAEPTAKATREVAQAAPLPAVISWLKASEDEAELPRPAPHAPIFRPPGAVAEADFLARCTQCGDCKSACPHDAIISAPLIFRGAAGTPMIDASQSPCRLCEDLPCITACATEALVEGGARMGGALIQEFDCLEHRGLACGICIEQCPIDGAILKGKRVPCVQPALCVGCGICHYACPAPVNAIVLLPNNKRQTPQRLQAKEPA